MHDKFWYFLQFHVSTYNIVKCVILIVSCCPAILSSGGSRISSGGEGGRLTHMRSFWRERITHAMKILCQSNETLARGGRHIDPPMPSGSEPQLIAYSLYGCNFITLARGIFFTLF